MRTTTFLLALTLLSFSACGDSGSDVDSGMHIVLDAAADTGADGGATDLGVDAGTVDMGLTGVCAQPVMPLPAMYVPRCTAATRACFDACPATSATCGGACLMADTTPPVTVSGQTLSCAGCFGQQEFACFDAMMCHDAVAAFDCCVQANCASTPTSACAMAMCPTQYMGLQTCAGAHAASCVTSAGMYVTDCFAPPVDGGTTTGDGGTTTGDASVGDGGTTVGDAGGTTTDDAGTSAADG